jgi:preprotein translocase subunit SecF
MGGGVIQDFALALIVGVGVGTYSSIFVASPVLLLLPEGKPSFSRRAAKKPVAAGRTAKGSAPAATPAKKSQKAAPKEPRKTSPAKTSAARKRSKKKRKKGRKKK